MTKARFEFISDKKDPETRILCQFRVSERDSIQIKFENYMHPIFQVWIQKNPKILTNYNWFFTSNWKPIREPSIFMNVS